MKYNSKYKLIGEITHCDISSANEHYIACCLADNGKYYYFNDTNVTEVNESKLYKNELFYYFIKS